MRVNECIHTGAEADNEDSQLGKQSVVKTAGRALFPFPLRISMSICPSAPFLQFFCASFGCVEIIYISIIEKNKLILNHQAAAGGDKCAEMCVCLRTCVRVCKCETVVRKKLI